VAQVSHLRATCRFPETLAVFERQPAVLGGHLARRLRDLRQLAGEPGLLARLLSLINQIGNLVEPLVDVRVLLELIGEFPDSLWVVCHLMSFRFGDYFLNTTRPPSCGTSQVVITITT
jgi:hypothetical protein